MNVNMTIKLTDDGKSLMEMTMGGNVLNKASF